MKATSEPKERDDLPENSSDEDEHKNNQYSDWLKERMKMGEWKSIPKLFQTVKQQLSGQSYSEK